jgi:ABC-2 type transport system permease protein
MRIIFAIAKREINAYFETALGWLYLLGFSGLSGFIFAWIVMVYTDPMANMGQPIGINDVVVPDFFGTMVVFLLLLSPALSMRSFAADRNTHALELLMSAPIRTSQIVLGKYLGILGFVAIMLASTSHCAILLFWLGDPSVTLILLNYLSTFLLAASFMAVGILTSAFTRSQLISLALSFAILLTLWFLAGVGEMASGQLAEVLSYTSTLTHLDTMSKGLLHTKDIVYFFSFIAFFLFVTHQRIESERWT